MNPLHARLADMIRARRDFYIDMYAPLVNRPGRNGKIARVYSRDEVSQIVDGWTAMITEALEDRGTEARDMYVGTMVSGVIAAGASLGAVMRLAVQGCVHVTADLVQQLPEADRAEATAWIADFYGRYFTDLTRAGLAALAQP